MHDDLLERRLRSALHEESASQPFTITAAELERRASLRGRDAGNRRLTLLLAAAVAIGGLGIGTLVAGFRDRTPTSTDPITAVTSPSPVAPPASPPRIGPAPDPAATLPSLDHLLAFEPGTVLVAQAHGPADSVTEPDSELPPERMSTSLGTVSGGTDFRVQVACLSRGAMSLTVREPTARDFLLNAAIPCDKQVVEHTFRSARPAEVSLESELAASWRVVLRGSPRPIPVPTENPVLPAVGDGDEELLRLDDRSVGLINTWGESGLHIDEAGHVAGRTAYAARLWCPWGGSIRVVMGHEFAGAAALTPDTETQVTCDGTIHEVEIGVPAPDGIGIWVAGPPLARYSLLVIADEPPVKIWDDLPGWRLNIGTGPTLAFRTGSTGVSTVVGEGDGSGSRALILLACIGPAPIVATVDLGDRQEVFEELCGPNGSLPALHEFETDTGAVDVSYSPAVGTWSAVSILEPAPSTAPSTAP